ncbi:MAG: hypothetical protein QOJ15_1976 [Bradyrhizobium sp.]|nr:hypothetical protein [Bradyrhizobium sp.]
MKTNIKRGLCCLSGLLFLAGTRLLASDFDANLEKTFSITGAGKLSIQADRGTIVVGTDGTDKVQVRVLRRVKGGSKADADELFSNHEVIFDQEGNKVTVVAKNKKEQRSWNFNRPNLEVRYQVNIPKKFEVDLKTAGGDITVADLDGNAATRTSSGSIKLAHISGAVDAADAGGDILVEEAGGKAVIRTSSGSIELHKARAGVEASDAGGDIRVGDAASDVMANTSSGSIKLANVKGAVEVKNAGGDIAIESADGSVKAATSSGSIKIKAVKGDLAARNAGGDIIIGEAGNDVVAQTSSGSIRIKSANGSVEARNAGGDISVQDATGKLVLNTSSGSIRIGRAKGAVEAKDSGGSVEIADARDAVTVHTSSGEITVNFSVAPKADSRLDVSGGGIKVSLPRSAGLDVDARASGGKVISEKPIAVVVKGESQRNGLQGKINGGGPALVLRASSGDIRLVETAKVEAEAAK